jgi:peptide/nickel transport system permease protein
LLSLLIAGLLDGGLLNIMIVLGIALIPGYAGVMCGRVLSIKGNDYVLGGHAIGDGNLRIMLRHIVPNCLPPLIVMITMMMGTTMLAEAGLSYLGIGVEEPARSRWSRTSFSYLWSGRCKLVASDLTTAGDML